MQVLNSQDYNTGWYYWTKNQYVHFIRFHRLDETVASGTVRRFSPFQFHVKGPHGYEVKGERDSLHDAKAEVNFLVLRIIEREFKEEYFPPLG